MSLEAKETWKKNRVIVHYCCGSYDLSQYGGEARYDYHIKLAFPKRIFVMQKDPRLLELCKQHGNNLLVITDNHLSCDVPNHIKTLLVHHGVAETHAEREPGWNRYWKELCCNGQKKMLFYRDPKTTKIVSISQFCRDEFERIYKNNYTKFKIENLLHCSELNELNYKKSFNNIPNIIGNWNGFNKGGHLINHLKNCCKEYNFNKLNVKIDRNGINDFNRRKQEIYLNNDMFLQLSLSEGNSYATLDALLCGLVVISTNVGLFYKDVPEDCFVMLEWNKINDINYVKSKIEYGWKNRELISKNCREWYMKNCKLEDWKIKINKIVDNFY